MLFPRPTDSKRGPLSWRHPAYRKVIAVLQNPFYAGAYAYGKSKVQTELVDGSLRKVYGRMRPMESWSTLLKDHHEAYVTWEVFEFNRRRLASNSYSQRAGSAKSSRGGSALMAGLLRCKRCGRMLRVAYSGQYHKPRYSCRAGRQMHGIEPCIAFGARHPELRIGEEILLVVQASAVASSSTDCASAGTDGRRNRPRSRRLYATTNPLRSQYRSLQRFSLAAQKHKEVTTVRVRNAQPLHQSQEPIVPFAHVHRLGCHPYLYAHRKHHADTASSNARASAAMYPGAVPPSNRTRAGPTRSSIAGRLTSTGDTRTGSNLAGRLARLLALEHARPVEQARRVQPMRLGERAGRSPTRLQA